MNKEPLFQLLYKIYYNDTLSSEEIQLLDKSIQKIYNSFSKEVSEKANLFYKQAIPSRKESAINEEVKQLILKYINQIIIKKLYQVKGLVGQYFIHGKTKFDRTLKLEINKLISNQLFVGDNFLHSVLKKPDEALLINSKIKTLETENKKRREHSETKTRLSLSAFEREVLNRDIADKVNDFRDEGTFKNLKLIYEHLALKSEELFEHDLSKDAIRGRYERFVKDNSEFRRRN